jgi:hypothetical protein
MQITCILLIIWNKQQIGNIYLLNFDKLSLRNLFTGEILLFSLIQNFKIMGQPLLEEKQSSHPNISEWAEGGGGSAFSSSSKFTI